MPEISRIVDEFIRKYIESVDALEILLLLRNTPQREWSALELSRELEFDSAVLAARLDQLKSTGLIKHRRTAHTQLYCYGPSTPEMSRAIDELARAYTTYRVRIIGMIFSKPLNKIQSFSDAFLFRKDDEEDK